MQGAESQRKTPNYRLHNVLSLWRDRQAIGASEESSQRIALSLQPNANPNWQQNQESKAKKPELGNSDLRWNTKIMH
jgi:uncharacterized protein involved in outer membrane biogenesis